MRASLTRLYKQIGYAVGMNFVAKIFISRNTNRFTATCMIVITAAWNFGCVTTTTPVNEDQWLPRRDAPTAVKQNAKSDEKSDAKSGALPNDKPRAQASTEPVVKPWDMPAVSATKSDLTQPSSQQMRQCLEGATWIKLDENGTRRRSLKLNADGTFVAKSDGESGELPAFTGLLVQAKGQWSVKENELRLLPHAGDPVVVQLQWLGDKRLVMMNGESWMRSQ